jgi:NAD(P)-dependent dehydrogenase (short-subunit alcohol dehydrogenase family)
MNIDFIGKRVLVTGGTRGIGRAIVEAFLATGAKVAVNGRSAESVAKAIASLGTEDNAVAVPGSVSIAEGCRVIVEAAAHALGGIDVLVNNAGIEIGKPVEDTPEADWDLMLDTNLKSVFFMSKYALPHLKKSKGNIINIASVLGLVGLPSCAVYCASKGAIIAMTRAFALEFAPDIRVNAVCPGGVDTDMLRSVAMQSAGGVEAGYAILSQAAAQKRIAHVDEIAGPVLYLASSLASFVTGSIHVVDGGETID